MGHTLQLLFPPSLVKMVAVLKLGHHLFGEELHRGHDVLMGPVAALGDKGGIARYGSAYSPMDETLARVALDISGRPYLVWRAGFSQEKLGEWDTELIEHWFHSVAQTCGLTLHVELLYGTNNHHICEAIYKGFARAMRAAVEVDPRKGGTIPSTKGQLGG